jgi:hypothetical protein
MKKTTRKMTLSRETLRMLDHSDLRGAEGAAGPPASFDPTCATRCFWCPVTLPTENTIVIEQ